MCVLQFKLRIRTQRLSWHIHFWLNFEEVQAFASSSRTVVPWSGNFCFAWLHWKCCQKISLLHYEYGGLFTKSVLTVATFPPMMSVWWARKTFVGLSGPPIVMCIAVVLFAKKIRVIFNISARVCTNCHGCNDVTQMEGHTKFIFKFMFWRYKRKRKQPRPRCVSSIPKQGSFNNSQMFPSTYYVCYQEMRQGYWRFLYCFLEGSLWSFR